MNKLMDKLLYIAVHHRAITVLAGLLVILSGIYAFKNLSMEAYPDFTNPMVRVVTLMPGKGAEEVERLVTIPLENELNGIPNERNLRSASIFGLSVIYVTFGELLQALLQLDQDILEAQVQLELSKSVFNSENQLFKANVSAKSEVEAASSQYSKDMVILNGLKTKRQATIRTYRPFWRSCRYGRQSGCKPSY